MLQAVLFDFDGVLTTDKYGSVSVAKFLSGRTGISYERCRAAYGKFNAAMLRGEKTQHEIWPDLCAELGIDPGPYLLDEASRATPMDEEMLSLVRELRQRYRIGMITDNPADRVHAALDHFGLRGLFDAVIISGSVGSRKDRPEIFERALAALDLPPEACAFIDNTASNLTVPARMGMKTIFFDDEARDMEGLRNELEKLA